MIGVTIALEGVALWSARVPLDIVCDLACAAQLLTLVALSPEKVLVDTTVWSLALRRRRRQPTEQALVVELPELIDELRAVLIGPVRQEVLSGIPDPKDFEVVREHLAAFDNLEIETCDYVQAAHLFNLCRKKGVQGSHVDFLICAVAKRHSAAIFTTDKDFMNYTKHINLEIHKPRRG